jgi:hypothetical protein
MIYFLKNAILKWEREQQLAFQTAKMLLVSAPILKHPTAEGKFEVHVDARGVEVGAVLIQSTIHHSQVTSTTTRRKGKPITVVCN